MTFKSAFTLLLIFAAGFSIAQDSTYLSQNEKRSNIVIIAKDGSSINGRVLEITIDYILLDADSFNSPLKLSKYFIRKTGNYYKIDVEYIQAAVVNTKKKVGLHAASGGLAGATVATLENSDATLSETAGAAAAGFVVGSLVGTAKGIGKRKKATIPVYGMPENLISLLNYYE